MKRSIAVLTLLLFVSTIGSVGAKPAIPVWRDAHPWSTEVAIVRVGDLEIQAEIADTSPLQTRGLGYRDGLAPGSGMIFLFDGAAPRSFWMKGMRFCLDIIWIVDGQIAGAAENACPMPELSDADLPRYRSVVPVDIVLEVPANWMQDNNIVVGSPVEIMLPGQ